MLKMPFCEHLDFKNIASIPMLLTTRLVHEVYFYNQSHQLPCTDKNLNQVQGVENDRSQRT